MTFTTWNRNISLDATVRRNPTIPQGLAAAHNGVVHAGTGHGTPPGYRLVSFEHFLGLCNPHNADRTLAILGLGHQERRLRHLSPSVKTRPWKQLQRTGAPRPQFIPHLSGASKTWFFGADIFRFSKSHLFSFIPHLFTQPIITLAPSSADCYLAGQRNPLSHMSIIASLGALCGKKVRL